MRINKKRSATAAAILGTLFWPAAATADEVADFYTGKTVSIITTSAGSTYDVYSRVLAGHLGQYIPGNPGVIVKNMPGAGGIRATNYLAGSAPDDGTELGHQQQTLAILQILYPKRVKFDLVKFNWVGRISDLTSTVTVWSHLPVKTIQDVTEQEVIVGSTGKGSGTYQIPTMLNQIVGTKFKVILGYKGIKGVDLAMQNGEAHGRYGSLLSWQVNHPDWVKAGKLRHLLQVTTRSEPELPGVPTLIGLARNDEERQIFKLISSQASIARSVFTTPGVPKARVEALRTAFNKTMRDKEFLDRAAQAKLPVNPLTGPELHALVSDALSISASTARKVRAALGIGDDS